MILYCVNFSSISCEFMQSLFESFSLFCISSRAQTFFWSEKQTPFLRKVPYVNNILILCQLLAVSFAYVSEPIQFYDA